MHDGGDGAAAARTGWKTTRPARATRATCSAQEGFTDEDLDRPIAKFNDPSAIQLTVAGSHAGKWTSIYTGMGWGRDVPARKFAPASAVISA